MAAETKQISIPPEIITGGVNDTHNKYRRGQSESRDQTNFRITPDAIITKLKGRETKTADFAASVTGLIVPPHDIAFCTLTSANNTLAYKYGGAVVATLDLTAGDYANHAALATELAARLNAAIVLVDPAMKTILVAYDVPTRKFTVTNGAVTGNSTLILCWPHASSTVDASLFGFKWATTVVFAAPVASDFPCPYDPPSDMLVPTAGSLYHDDKVQMTHPDAAAIVASANKWSGVWNNSRWYGTNGDKSFISRDNKYIRKFPSLDGLGGNMYAYMLISEATKSLYSLTEGAAKITLQNLKGLRIELTAPSTALHLVNHVVISCSKAANNSQFKIGMYLVSQDRNGSVESAPVHHLIRYITGSDMTTSRAGLGTYIPSADAPVSCPPIYALSQTGTAYLELILESGDGAGFEIYYKAVAGTYDTMDANGVWTTVAGNAKIRATVEVEELAGGKGATKYTKYKGSFTNAEGFETNLSDVLIQEASVAAANILARIDFPTWQKMDIKYFNLYRTECDKAVYYRVAQIPINQWYAQTNLTWYDGVSDANLLFAPIGDLLTTRTPMPAFKKVIWWDNRLWGIGKADAPGVIYFSAANEPEHFNLAEWFCKSNDEGYEVMDLAELGDRLVFITERGIGMLVSAGDNAYSVINMKNNGIGTNSHWSAVSVLDGTGKAVYFQGNDGHFYRTNGVQLECISQGKLETMVGG